MRADLDRYLAFETDADLRASLELPVIEDSARLDVATWKEARTRFDEWAWEELKQRPEFDQSWEISKREEKVGYMINRLPHLEFFIYADKASVDSVVGCVDIKADGAYFFTLVATALKKPRVVSYDDDYNIIEDDEEEEEAKSALWQRFKVNEVAIAYSSVAIDQWPGYLRGKDGISLP